MTESDFWYRRKARVRAEEAEAEAARTRAEAEAAQAKAAERTDAELCADLDLPDPDMLGPGDDVRAFMAEAVPDRLRRRALRQLWRTNPTLANLDALVDYGEDYTDAARVVADLQTAYQVGRGIVREITEVADVTEGPDDPAMTADADPARARPDAPTIGGSDSADRPSDNSPDASRPVASARQGIRDNSPSDAPRDFGDTVPEEEERARPKRRMRFAFAPPDPGAIRDQETR
jgi:hypothetical protein